jgi:hypothetical protein
MSVIVADRRLSQQMARGLKHPAPTSIRRPLWRRLHLKTRTAASRSENAGELGSPLSAWRTTKLRL